jgi:hypothetical protein
MCKSDNISLIYKERWHRLFGEWRALESEGLVMDSMKFIHTMTWLEKIVLINLTETPHFVVTGPFAWENDSVLHRMQLYKDTGKTRFYKEKRPLPQGRFSIDFNFGRCIKTTHFFKFAFCFTF